MENPNENSDCWNGNSICTIHTGTIPNHIRDAVEIIEGHLEVSPY